MNLRILYLGSANGTSLQRSNALRRLGHVVVLVDPRALLPTRGFAGRIIEKLIYQFGGCLFVPYIRVRLLWRLKEQLFDLVWVDSGELLSSATLSALRTHVPKIVNYNHDDPFGKRDKQRFKTYLGAVAEYDLLAVVRTQNVVEAINAGARQVTHVFRAADEVCHAPMMLTEQEKSKWVGDVVFVGTWMPERGPFLTRLIKLGVPLKIYGDRWQKADEWETLKKTWVGPNLSGADYVKAIQCAKVNLGLLSKGNHDLHTTRSAEITYIGSVLCAERTSEHEAMYRENEEAVFWSSPEECAEKCFWLLGNADIRESIAQAGRKKCIANGMLNEVVMKKILDAAMTLVPMNKS